MARVEGLARLRSRLSNASRRVPNEVKAVVAEEADRIVAAMKARAPVDSGALRDSIGWTFGTAPQGSIAIVQGLGRGDIAVTIYAGGSAAYYAHIIEFGSVNSAAQAFFYPTFREMRGGARRRIAKAVARGLR